MGVWSSALPLFASLFSPMSGFESGSSEMPQHGKKGDGSHTNVD